MSRKNKKINFQIYKKVEEETKKEPKREDKIIELFEEFIKKTQKIYSLLNMIGTIMDEKFESNKKIKKQIQSKNKISEDDKVINLSLSKDELDNYKSAYRENNILSLHVEIIPSTFLIYLESSFESFISDVLTLTFNLYPWKLDDSIVKFTFSDLKNLNSIDDAKDYLLKKTISDIFWKNRSDQMEEISKIIDEKDFYRFIQLENLVEVSLRRNIFTHNDGKVNKIYIDACGEYWIANDKKDGDKLVLDGDYFVKLYDTYFDFWVKITYFTLIHHCDTEEKYDTAANFVNDKIFTLIKSDKNETAIWLTNFILEGKYCKKLTESMKLYVLINKAIALKNIWKIDEKNKIIQSIDWSAKTNLFKLAKAVLEENWWECAILMQKVATKERSEENIEELSDREWRLWPLFKDFRETKEFKSGYKIFYWKEYINTLE